MSLFRPVDAVDVLFLAVVGLLCASWLATRLGRRQSGHSLGALAWAGFTGFWVLEAVAYLDSGRFVLGIIGLVTMVVAGWTAMSHYRGELLAHRLTMAFAVMGLLFVPFQFLHPVQRLVLETVTGQTVWLLEWLGLSPIVLPGPAGYANVITFPGVALSQAIEVGSACSGISALALFVGLLAATDAPIARRLAAIAGVLPLIYALNLARTAFSAGALGGEWFATIAHPIVSPLAAVDPAVASFYLAEHFVSQVLVVVVLVSIYLGLTTYLPRLQEFVGGVTGSLATSLRQPLRGGRDV